MRGSPAKPAKPAQLQVIGAGWGRTGTSSTQIALEKLLGGPCYHMRERPGFGFRNET